MPEPTETGQQPPGTYWRLEGSLINLGAVRPVAFFTWNAQSIFGRWARRSGVGLLALFRPLLYATNRVFATRVLHTLLRGVSRDRLDLLGEEYFEYVLKPRLKANGVQKLKEIIAGDRSVILVSQGLDHIMRPLADYLGVERVVANRLEFRDGLATGRLLDPVIRPRGALARLVNGKPDGRIPAAELSKSLGLGDPGVLDGAVIEAKRQTTRQRQPIVLFDETKSLEEISVLRSLAGKHVLLVGSTGFIGKVWLGKILRDVPDIGMIYLLIRPGRSTSAVRRFERIVAESPVFEAFHERYGGDLAEFLGERVEVVEGDICKADLGLDLEVRSRLIHKLDLIINSAGLTDFNPDLRAALAINVDGTVNLVNFARRCDRAGLLHLSTCYVAGFRDGRVKEKAGIDYTPACIEGFDADQERLSLYSNVRDIEARAESPEVTAELRRQAQTKNAKGEMLVGPALENQVRKNRIRWVRDRLIEAGMKRARELGWPNTYTLTKSLAESLILKAGSRLPVAIVRPSIVETSTEEPFRGWNEGVNTSAPISYLLGTFFRQFPSNERKCLDLIPVDLVCRGLTLIAAAIVERRHRLVYQLATSAVNPCDMRRSVELTGLAHRKYYRSQDGFEHRLRARFESIPVSKARYQNLSAPRQKAVVQALQRLSAALPMARPPLARKERVLDRVEKLIELYEPFILHNEHVFDAENVVLLSEALPPNEKAVFGYDPLSIDWWEYWINIHIPALRKWSYPLIEGRPLEYDAPQRSFRMSSKSTGGPTVGGAALAPGQ